MAAACPAVDDVPSSLPPPKKPQHMTWAMSLASAYARIFSALESGRDVLAMPPVGSLRLDCYRQLVKQLTGITLIISSYKERMEKEIDILEKDGIPAAMLHSGLSDYAMAAQLERIRRRHFQVLFASPGLLEDPKMRSFLVFKTTISLIVIDEAQICSIHAPHFQPLYHSIPLLLKDLERHAASSRPPVLALTLPTTRQMEQDIGHFFSLQHPLLVRHAFECPNLFLSVHRPQRKAPFLLDFLRRHEDEAGIIYCTEHRLTEHIAQLLNRSGFPALSYHAGLTREERMANARAFCAGAPSSDRRIQRPSTHDAEAHAGARILVVTPDPFLELDRSDVRFVLHYTMPESLERYYQELVHAGRDGLPAECILLANERDFELQRTKLEKVTLGYQAYPEAVAQVKRQLEAMRRYAMTHQCLRSFLRDYFGGEDPVDYEVITLPSRNRVLTSAELPVDESLRTIRQSGHYPKNRVQKVSMQLKRAEKQHIFIRYADQAYMKNQAYKYEHLRTDPWELCEPGIRVQRFRAFSIPRDSCCVNCDPEHFLEEDRYGISDTMGLQERMREHRHQLETDMDVGRKIRLWKAGEKPYHFDYDAHTKCTGRIMAMRKVEYQKTAATMAAVLGQSSKSSIETPAHASTAPGASSSVPESPADDRLPATTPCEGNASVRTNDGKAGRGGYARGSDDEAGSVGYARTDDAEAGRGGYARTGDGEAGRSGYARTSDGEAEAQQLRLLENARLEISPEMRTHLLGNLKALRKRLAMERSVQAYLIFTDKSLVEMCRMLPLTREEFARIYGVGQRKLELHYEAFIDEIRKALDPAYVADFYENVSEEMQVDMQDGTGACVTGERTGMNDSADPVRVAEFYANASEEVQCTAGERTGMNDSVDAARVKRAPGTYAPCSNPVIPTSVIKPIPQERSESQRNPKYRFIPDDVLLAFLEEKYLQQRTRKQVKKKQDFFLTVAEAASFRCADGLRSPEIAALLNALVAEAEEISSTNSPIASIDVGVSDNGSTSAAVTTGNPFETQISDAVATKNPFETQISAEVAIENPGETQISDAVATENPGETQTSNAVAMENPGEIQISDAVAAKNPGELTNQQKPRVRERKKLSGATINRKLAELGYLKLSEYRFNGRPHQTFLPTTKGEAAGIVLGTRKSQGGVDYPTAYFSAAAASWVATLFVRDETK